MPDGTKHSVNDDYGNGRIRMTPVDDNFDYAPKRDRGYYLHGKHAWYRRTHGCVCDKKEKIFNYFWSSRKGMKIRGKVPFAVNIPYRLID